MLSLDWIDAELDSLAPPTITQEQEEENLVSERRAGTRRGLGGTFNNNTKLTTSGGDASRPALGTHVTLESHGFIISSAVAPTARERNATGVNVAGSSVGSSSPHVKRVTATGQSLEAFLVSVRRMLFVGGANPRHQHNHHGAGTPIPELHTFTFQHLLKDVQRLATSLQCAATLQLDAAQEMGAAAEVNNKNDNKNTVPEVEDAEAKRLAAKTQAAQYASLLSSEVMVQQFCRDWLLLSRTEQSRLTSTLDEAAETLVKVEREGSAGGNARSSAQRTTAQARTVLHAALAANSINTRSGSSRASKTSSQNNNLSPLFLACQLATGTSAITRCFDLFAGGISVGGCTSVLPSPAATSAAGAQGSGAQQGGGHSGSTSGSRASMPRGFIHHQRFHGELLLQDPASLDCLFIVLKILWHEVMTPLLEQARRLLLPLRSSNQANSSGTSGSPAPSSNLVGSSRSAVGPEPLNSFGASGALQDRTLLSQQVTAAYSQIFQLTTLLEEAFTTAGENIQGRGPLAQDQHRVKKEALDLLAEAQLSALHGCTAWTQDAYYQLLGRPPGEQLAEGSAGSAGRTAANAAGQGLRYNQLQSHQVSDTQLFLDVSAIRLADSLRSLHPRLAHNVPVSTTTATTSGAFITNEASAAISIRMALIQKVNELTGSELGHATMVHLESVATGLVQQLVAPSYLANPWTAHSKFFQGKQVTHACRIFTNYWQQWWDHLTSHVPSSTISTGGAASSLQHWLSYISSTLSKLPLKHRSIATVALADNVALCESFATERSKVDGNTWTSLSKDHFHVLLAKACHRFILSDGVATFLKSSESRSRQQVVDCCYLVQTARRWRKVYHSKHQQHLHHHSSTGQPGDGHLDTCRDELGVFGAELSFSGPAATSAPNLHFEGCANHNCTHEDQGNDISRVQCIDCLLLFYTLATSVKTMPTAFVCRWLRSQGWGIPSASINEAIDSGVFDIQEQYARANAPPPPPVLPMADEDGRDHEGSESGAEKDGACSKTVEDPVDAEEAAAQEEARRRKVAVEYEQIRNKAFDQLVWNVAADLPPCPSTDDNGTTTLAPSSSNLLPGLKFPTKMAEDYAAIAGLPLPSDLLAPYFEATRGGGADGATTALRQHSSGTTDLEQQPSQQVVPELAVAGGATPHPASEVPLSSVLRSASHTIEDQTALVNKLLQCRWQQWDSYPPVPENEQPLTEWLRSKW